VRPRAALAAVKTLMRQAARSSHSRPYRCIGYPRLPRRRLASSWTCSAPWWMHKTNRMVESSRASTQRTATRKTATRIAVPRSADAPRRGGGPHVAYLLVSSGRRERQLSSSSQQSSILFLGLMAAPQFAPGRIAWGDAPTARDNRNSAARREVWIQLIPARSIDSDWHAFADHQFDCGLIAIL